MTPTQISKLRTEWRTISDKEVKMRREIAQLEKKAKAIGDLLSAYGETIWAPKVDLTD